MEHTSMSPDIYKRTFILPVTNKVETTIEFSVPKGESLTIKENPSFTIIKHDDGTYSFKEEEGFYE